MLNQGEMKCLSGITDVDFKVKAQPYENESSG